MKPTFFLTFMIITISLLVACQGGEIDRDNPDAVWYEGGNLQQATVEDWRKATQENKLATSYDWVTTIVGWDTIEEAKEKSEQVVACVDDAVRGSDVKDRLVAEVGVACMIMQGWPDKNG